MSMSLTTARIIFEAMGNGEAVDAAEARQACTTLESARPELKAMDRFLDWQKAQKAAQPQPAAKGKGKGKDDEPVEYIAIRAEGAPDELIDMAKELDELNAAAKAVRVRMAAWLTNRARAKGTCPAGKRADVSLRYLKNGDLLKYFWVADKADKASDNARDFNDVF